MTGREREGEKEETGRQTYPRACIMDIRAVSYGIVGSSQPCRHEHTQVLRPESEQAKDSLTEESKDRKRPAKPLQTYKGTR